MMILILDIKVVATQIFFESFTPNFGEDEPILTVAYFSKGLVQPPTRTFFGIFIW